MAFPSILGCHRCSQTELFNSVRQCCFRPRLRGWSTYTVTVCSLVSPHCMNSGAILLLLYCCYHFMKSTFQAKKKNSPKTDLFCHWCHILLSITSEKKTLPVCRCRNRARSLSLLCDAFETTLLSSSSFYTAAPLWWILIWGAGWFWQSVNLSSLRWLINNRKRDGLWC